MEPEPHIDSAALDRSLAVLAPTASGGDRLSDSLEHVLTAARELFSASGAGFMMLDDNGLLCAVAATDAPGRLLEERQVDTGHGPCVDAVTLGTVTSTEDLAEDDRWPQLLPELPEAGVRAVLGMPIRASGVAVGSVNVYRDRPHAWDASEIAALNSYGLLIERLLLTALQARQRELLAQQLQYALDHRVVIERAVGVIMGRERVSAATAYNRLRDSARAGERKVAEVAEQMLAGVVRDGL